MKISLVMIIYYYIILYANTVRGTNIAAKIWNYSRLLYDIGTLGIIIMFQFIF